MFTKGPITRPLKLFCPILAVLLAPGGIQAQEKTDVQPGALKQILDRLDRLEHENHDLADEVHALRTELAAARSQPAQKQPAEAETAQGQTATPSPLPEAPPPEAPLEERVQVAEQRAADLSQEKVEASQRFPISLTGMVLFNAFLNGKNAGGAENPTYASAVSGPATNGATIAQTVLGLRYESPRALWGAQVNGSVFFDFYGGDGTSLDHTARLRTAAIQLDWTNTSVMVGQDKPLIAPRDPFSLAQVGVSAFTGAGNLWLWSPQAKVEERFKLGDNSGLRAQIGLYEMGGTYTYTESTSYPNSVVESSAGPALEGRFEFWHRFGEHTRIELAPGFHTAQTTEDGVSVPSRLFSFDWFANPWEKIEFTGTFYDGENIAGLGTIGPGYFVVGPAQVRPVQAMGGWAQLAWLATPKLTFHLIAGQHNNQESEVSEGLIYKNQGYAANLVYRLAPNVLFSLEGMQVRTSWVGSSGTRLNNHYDLGVAYLF
jgi:hypothetical protein